MMPEPTVLVWLRDRGKSARENEEEYRRQAEELSNKGFARSQHARAYARDAAESRAEAEMYEEAVRVVVRARAVLGETPLRCDPPLPNPTAGD